MVGGSQIALFTQPYKERYALQSRKVEGRERETKGVSNRSVNTKKGNWSVARKRTNRGDGDDDQRAVNFRGLSGKEREGGGGLSEKGYTGARGGNQGWAPPMTNNEGREVLGASETRARLPAMLPAAINLLSRLPARQKVACAPPPMKYACPSPSTSRLGPLRRGGKTQTV